MSVAVLDRAVEAVVLAPVSLAEYLIRKKVATFDLPNIRAYQAGFLARMWEKGRRDSCWDTVGLDDFRRYGDFLGRIPPHIESIVALVADAPEAELVVDWFYLDPFLFIQRHLGGEVVEIHCIGFWNTPGFTPVLAANSFGRS